jgi:glutaredoxin
MFMHFLHKGDKMNIVIYGREICPKCVVAKNYLRSKGVGFVYKDIDEPDFDMEELGGRRALPVIRVENDLMGLEELREVV